MRRLHTATLLIPAALKRATEKQNSLRLGIALELCAPLAYAMLFWSRTWIA